MLRSWMWINFFLLGFPLGHTFFQFLSIFFKLNNQWSVVVTLAACGLTSLAGKWFAERVARIVSSDARRICAVSTFIYLASFLNLAFSPFAALNLFHLIPWLLLAVFRFRSHDDPWDAFENTANALMQILALAFIINIHPSTTIGIACASLIWAGTMMALYLIQKKFILHAWQPLLVCWFFLCLSNQTQVLAPRFSYASLMLACVSVPVLLFLWLKKPRWNVTLSRLCVGAFVMSFIIDINLGRLLALSPEKLNGQWWLHVAPGLEAIYSKLKPFIHYYPAEGVFWQTYLPRICFEWLNLSFIKYFFVLIGLGVVAHLIYIALVSWALWKWLSIAPWMAILSAAALVITNSTLLQVYAAHPYAWCILEKTPLLLLCALVLTLLHGASKRWRRPFIFAAVGVLHAASFLFDATYGMGGIVGLALYLIISKAQASRWLAEGSGLLGAFTIYLLSMGIPWWNFYFNYPATLLQSITQNAHAQGFFQISQAFDRRHFLVSLHHLMPLIVFALYLSMLPWGSYRQRAFPIVTYFFVATLVTYLLRGGELLQFSTVVPSFEYANLPAFSLVLMMPLFIGSLRLALDTFPAARLASLQKLGACLLVAAVFTDGMFTSPGKPEEHHLKFDLETSRMASKESQTSHLSWGFPSLVEHAYQYKNRTFTRENNQPLRIHRIPAREWKNDPAFDEIYSTISESLRY